MIHKFKWLGKGNGKKEKKRKKNTSTKKNFNKYNAHTLIPDFACN